MDFYLGLTGLPGTGKEAVSKLIAAELAAHGVHTLHYSLSGPIAVELQRRGLPPDREQYRTVANEVRANLGNGAWATRIAREIRETLAAAEWSDVFVMIDGVRNPAEIAVFKTLWGSRFQLLAVSAPEDVRRRNLTVRSSPKDAAVIGHLAAAPHSPGADSPPANGSRPDPAAPDPGGADLSALAPVLTAEMGVGQPQHGTNVLACIELAGWKIDNAEYDPAMRSLRGEVRDLVEHRVLPLYRSALAPAPASVLAPAAPRSSSEGAARVLVVESDPAWQAQLAALLAEEGCAVEFAADYAAASHKLLAQPVRRPYHLLTVDLHLPAAADGDADGETGGYGLLESLHYFDRSLPTILVSAGADVAQVGRAFRDFDVRDCFGKGDFAPRAFRSRVRSLLQSPFYAVATLEAGAGGYLLQGQACTLSIRIQRDAPVHRPPLGDVRTLLRPCLPDEWPVGVTLTSPDLRIEFQPGPSQQLAVPANCLAEPLLYTLTPLSAGNGRLELEFHQPGQFVDRLAFNVAVRAEN
jgi:dephospho-CoA kinase/CheY-like chemotaxis protein